MTEIKTCKRTGLVYPTESGCEDIIKQAFFLADYGGIPCGVQLDGLTVMDAGANIGAFTKRALVDGAKKVTCYEPFPPALMHLTTNVGNDPRVEIIEKALTTKEKEGELITLYHKAHLGYTTSRAPSPANFKRYGWSKMELETISFWDEVDRIRPDFVKMDIEYEEWPIFAEGRIFPEFVKGLAIEFHIQQKKFGGVPRCEETLEQMFAGGEVYSTATQKMFGKPFTYCALVRR